MRKNRRSYDKAFKQEAARLVVEEGRKPTEVERNLGIGKGTVGSKPLMKKCTGSRPN